MNMKVSNMVEYSNLNVFKSANGKTYTSFEVRKNGLFVGSWSVSGKHKTASSALRRWERDNGAYLPWV